MMQAIVWLGVALLACVGMVQVAAWAAVRLSRRNNRVFRVIPVGGEGKNTGDQMSLLYACLQWEANPSRQAYVLYGVGLDEEARRACAELARGVGIFFVESADELDALLRLP